MSKITGLNSKCFAKGSDFPAYKNGVIRLYGMRYCPYSERAALTLCAKGLDCEVINLNLVDKPEWFVKSVNPLGKVPTVQYDDKIVYESLVVAEWLDEQFPGPKILPNDPYEKAKQKMMIERCSKVQPSIITYLRNKTEDNLKEIAPNVLLLESLLTKDYFSGSSVGFADYMMWPSIVWCELLPSILDQSQNPYNKTQCPKLVAYVERMKARPEIQAVYRTPKERLDFMKTSLAGKPDFDIGL